jgi:perosamine synthetase
MQHRPIGVYEPWVSDEDVSALTRVAASGWISSASPEVKIFERCIAEYVGTNEAIAVMNGTTALHLAMVSLGVGPGDEVIVPDLTFVATAAAVAAAGARPVFADISAQDWNIDPAEIVRLKTSRTKAVLVVHLYGNPVDCHAIAKDHPELIVVEDSAEALGASIDGHRVGSMGRCATFSFYGNKTVTTGEGGMITTNSAELADRMRFLRDHAMSREKRYYHPELGWNYRMTAMQAAIGNSQMNRIEEILAKKRHLAQGYAERLRDVPGVELHPVPPGDSQGSYWMYSILLRSQPARDRVAAALSLSGVESRPFFVPMSQLPPFAEHAGQTRRVSTDIASRGLSLPSGPLLSEADLDFICEIVVRTLKPAMLEKADVQTSAA